VLLRSAIVGSPKKEGSLIIGSPLPHTLLIGLACIGVILRKLGTETACTSFATRKHKLSIRISAVYMDPKIPDSAQRLIF
jgi:hypothetical protein